MSLFDAGHGIPAITLADLLAVEDTPELLTAHCPQTGIPVWPNLRVAFLRQIMADLLFGTGSIDPPAGKSTWQAAGTLGRAAVHNAKASIFRQLRADVMLNTEAIGDEFRDGRWFNRYVDPFADLRSGQAVVMTDMFEWQWRMPRYNERIFYHAPIQTGAVIAGRSPWRGNAMKLADEVTALACERARTLLGWNMGQTRQSAFVKWAGRKIAGVPFRYRAYRRLLRRVQPRLLLGSSGCYGAHAPLIAAARDLGIVTAEYQHGAISSGHDAYNFAPAICSSEAYRRTLPQYMLTYGKWWGEQISAPVECIAVGNPARTAKLEQMPPPIESRSTVLILADGIEFDLYLDLARTIAAAIAGTGLEVALRPHPMERSAVLERYGKSIDVVNIDVAPDIYTSFQKAHTVVSEMSTGLFEAVGIVERIILLSTAKARFAFPEHPFVAASSIQESIDLIRDKDLAKPKADGDELWTPGWQEKYYRFLKNKAGVIN